MATYTYKCTNEKCDIYDVQFDVVHSVKQDSLTTCPECNEESLQKIITGVPGFRSVVNGLNRFRVGK